MHANCVKQRLFNHFSKQTFTQLSCKNKSMEAKISSHATSRLIMRIELTCQKLGYVFVQFRKSLLSSQTTPQLLSRRRATFIPSHHGLFPASYKQGCSIDSCWNVWFQIINNRRKANLVQNNSIKIKTSSTSTHT